MTTKSDQNRRWPIVHYPAEVESKAFQGKLYGYFHQEANEYNVLAFGENNGVAGELIGFITDNKESRDEGKLVGIWEKNQLTFWQGDRACKKAAYDLLLDIFSRNTGILETDMMLEASAVISGVGSVGSLVALELARSGVGHFLLVDHETFSYHNICRHQLGMNDVGKFKVHALKERILQINPHAKVITETNILERLSKGVFDRFITPNTIVVGCADNREGDLYGNHIAALYDIPFVSIGFWERACAGEVFYTHPGKMPCYRCVFGENSAVQSLQQSANRRHYTTEEDLSKVRFEPGISTDINFITTIGIKLILDLLNRHNKQFIPRLLGNLAQFTLICNTDDPQVGGEKVEIFSYPLQVTKSIHIDYAEGCTDCSIARIREM